MIRRTFDADRINELVNDPENMTPSWASLYPLDLSQAVAGQENYFFEGQHGGVCFCWSSPATFETHAFVLKSGRGRWARRFISDAMRQMRDTGARSLWARVRPDDRHIAIFSRALGFAPAGNHVLHGPDGACDYDIYEWRA